MLYLLPSFYFNLPLSRVGFYGYHLLVVVGIYLRLPDIPQVTEALFFLKIISFLFFISRKYYCCFSTSLIFFLQCLICYYSVLVKFSFQMLCLSLAVPSCSFFTSFVSSLFHIFFTFLSINSMFIIAFLTSLSANSITCHFWVCFYGLIFLLVPGYSPVLCSLGPTEDGTHCYIAGFCFSKNLIGLYSSIWLIYLQITLVLLRLFSSKLWPTPVFVNKILVEHSYPPLLSVVCGCFYATTVEFTVACRAYSIYCVILTEELCPPLL